MFYLYKKGSTVFNKFIHKFPSEETAQSVKSTEKVNIPKDVEEAPPRRDSSPVARPPNVEDSGIGELDVANPDNIQLTLDLTDIDAELNDGQDESGNGGSQMVDLFGSLKEQEQPSVRGDLGLDLNLTSEAAETGKSPRVIVREATMSGNEGQKEDAVDVSQIDILTPRTDRSGVTRRTISPASFREAFIREAISPRSSKEGKSAKKARSKKSGKSSKSRKSGKGAKVKSAGSSKSEKSSHSKKSAGKDTARKSPTVEGDERAETGAE